MHIYMFDDWLLFAQFIYADFHYLLVVYHVIPMHIYIFDDWLLFAQFIYADV